MTTRADILKKISKAAKKADLGWEFEREGGNHSIFKLDGLQVPVARHKGEVGNRYAESVYKECEAKLGKDWWR